jgi:outer membrane protein TolC
MKLASREANFGDFGFKDFLGGIGQMMGAAGGNFNQFSAMMSNPSAQKQMLDTEPDDLNNPDSRTNFESKLVYEYPLYVGGKLKSAGKMASLQIMANEAKYQSDTKKLGIEVVKAYNGAVTAKSFIKLTEESKKVALGFIKKAQKLYDDGLARMIDVKQAKMAYQTIDAKLAEAKANYKLAIAYLQFITNNENIDDVADIKNFNLNSDNLAYLQEKAVQDRDDYKWMNFNLQTMKEKINFDSSNKYPVIGAHAEYGFNDDSLTLSTKKDFYLVAVGLEYTIFDGYRTSIANQRAKIEYQKVKHYQDYMKDGISLEVKKYFVQIKTQEKVLKEKQKVAVMADEIMTEMEELYSNNLRFRTNMMYLLMQLGNMVQAKADVIMSTYDKSFAEANLKLALGKSLQADQE